MGAIESATGSSSSQDWYHWDASTSSLPLMYELPAWKIRTLMIRYREDLEGLFGDQIPIRIYPGREPVAAGPVGPHGAGGLGVLRRTSNWRDDVHVAKEQQVDPLGGTPGDESTASPSPAAAPSASPASSTSEVPLPHRPGTPPPPPGQ